MAKIAVVFVVALKWIRPYHIQLACTSCNIICILVIPNCVSQRVLAIYFLFALLKMKYKNIKIKNDLKNDLKNKISQDISHDSF